MKLCILKMPPLLELKRSVKENLDKYLSGDFNTYFMDPANLIELDLEIDINRFAEFLPGKTNKDEVHNCILMSEILKEITPYMARDERLWVYLTHTYLLDYSRQRWELGKKSGNDLIRHIDSHFFASDKRGIERDNAAARLWWIAALCNRVEGVPLKDVLDCLLLYSDVRASIIERPTTSQCLNVFSALAKKLFAEYKKEKTEIFERKTFRELMKKLNLFGGIKLLDTMKECDINSFIDKTLSNI